MANALPLLLAGGAALLLLGGKKKKSSGSRVSGNFGDYASATAKTVDFAKAQAAINRFPKQLWVIVKPGDSRIPRIKKALRSAAAARKDIGFALVNCELFVPYEGPESCDDGLAGGRAGTWEFRTPKGVVLEGGDNFDTPQFTKFLADLTKTGVSTSPYPPAPAPGTPGSPAPAPKPSKPEATKPEELLEPLVIEQLLDDLGYPPGPIDGAMDPETTVAIESFQMDWNSMMEWLWEHQDGITSETPHYGKIKVDGFWGPKTEAKAIRAYDTISGHGAFDVVIDGEKILVDNFRDMVIKSYAHTS